MVHGVDNIWEVEYEVSVVSQSVIVYSNTDHSTCNGNGQRKGKVKFLLLFCEVLPLCFFLSAILIFIFIISWDTIHHDF